MSTDLSVLHVDDEATFAEITAEFLTQTDDSLTVVTETDPTDALERLRATPDEIDCVVSDYKMPEMDGLELLEAVRVERPALPFILFTGRGNEGTAAKAISAGVTDYIQKQAGSETYELLAHRIRNAVESHRARGDAARTQRALEAALEHTTDVLAVVTPAHEVVYVSNAVEEVLGYTPTEVRDRGPFEFVHPDDRAMVEAHFERRLADDDAPTDLTFHARHANGEYRETQARAYELGDDEPIEGVLVYTHERELAEAV